MFLPQWLSFAWVGLRIADMFGFLALVHHSFSVFKMDWNGNDADCKSSYRCGNETMQQDFLFYPLAFAV